MLGIKHTGDFVTYILKPDSILPNTFINFNEAPPFTPETNVHFPKVFIPQSSLLLGFAYFGPFDQMILLFELTTGPEKSSSDFLHPFNRGFR
jgi:hypothetical protein